MSRSYRPSTTAYFLFNLLSLGLTSFGLYAITKRPLPLHLVNGGKFQFLTNISLLITIITLTSNLVSIALPNSSLLNPINLYLNAIAIIAETIVALIYWSLKLFFLDLIVNVALIEKQNFIPLYLDLIIHLFPITVLSLNFFFFKPTNFNIPLKKVVLVVLSLTVGYWIQLERVVDKANGGQYPYPFLNVDTHIRAGIFFVVSLAALLIYTGFEFVHVNVFQKLIFKTTTTTNIKKQE